MKEIEKSQMSETEKLALSSIYINMFGIKMVGSVLYIFVVIVVLLACFYS